MSTWADLENGIRFDGAQCFACGRMTYARHADRIIRCDGCGETTAGCMCSPARPLDVLS